MYPTSSQKQEYLQLFKLFLKFEGYQNIDTQLLKTYFYDFRSKFKHTLIFTEFPTTVKAFKFNSNNKFSCKRPKDLFLLPQLFPNSGFSQNF